MVERLAASSLLEVFGFEDNRHAVVNLVGHHCDHSVRTPARKSM
jgi:hypothetical protein